MHLITGFQEAIAPTKLKYLKAVKTCDIINPVSLVSGADFCYIFQPFKHLNCLRYTKHIATLAEFVLLASVSPPSIPMFQTF
jgi:hypothetical protein